MIRFALLGSSASVLLAGAVQGAPAMPPEPPARWLLTGGIHVPSSGHAATLLSDGRVLVCGGRTWTTTVARCETWSPVTEQWTAAGALRHPRSDLAAGRLDDGRVALIGGRGSSDVDVWDPRRNEVVGAGALPFVAERPHAVRLPDGRLFVLDDGPDSQTPRAAVWDPATGKSSVEDAPKEAGQTAALLMDAQGTLTLVRSRIGCRETTIWRRRPGQAWVLAHLDPSVTCATGAFALDDQQIIYWSRYATPCAMLWSSASGQSRSVDVPLPKDQEALIPLGGGHLLAVESGHSHLYVPGRGWRATGLSGAGDESSYTPLPDGRVLTVSLLRTLLWTPADFSAGGPCPYLAAELRGASGVRPIHLDGPTPDNVDPGCRAAIAGDPSLEVSRALRALAENPAAEGGAAGIRAICEFRPEWAVDLMTRGLEPQMSHDEGAKCLAALADSDQPAARQAVDGYLQDCVRGDRTLTAVIAAAGSSEQLRARTGGLLVAAWAAHESQFDQLRAVTCRVPTPNEAAAICRKADKDQEWEWREAPKRQHAWLVTGVVTAIGAGLALGGYANQNNDLGRGLAIAAGALGAGALFVAPFVADSKPEGPLSGLRDAFMGWAAATGVALGATGAALGTSKPGASRWRAAISIIGGTLFTAVSVAAAWKF